MSTLAGAVSMWLLPPVITSQLTALSVQRQSADVLPAGGCYSWLWGVQFGTCVACRMCLLQTTGKVTFNGRTFKQFLPQRTAAYIDQVDNHYPELTVRETFDFAARTQGECVVSWGKAGEGPRGLRVRLPAQWALLADGSPLVLHAQLGKSKRVADGACQHQPAADARAAAALTDGAAQTLPSTILQGPACCPTCWRRSGGARRSRALSPTGKLMLS